jgi:hypothetical protein
MGRAMIGRPEMVTLARAPDYDDSGAAMEFRLTYEGLLLGASRNSPRPDHKHSIRKVFHKQLRRLFELHPAFQMYRYQDIPDYNHMMKDERIHRQLAYEEVLKNFEKSGFTFFPLATRRDTLLCGVHVLFLRPDVPGSVIASGDIDNRLKTIFDALRLPRDRAETGGSGQARTKTRSFAC